MRNTLALKLEQLRTLIDVVDLGTFTAAAERRGVSQPAASLHIRELERSLNVRLIERVGKRASPTPEGERLAEHARRILVDVSIAVTDITAFSEKGGGRVRIGTGATACIYLLPQVLSALRQKLPEVEIVISMGNTSDILKMIEENSLDVGFVTMPAAGRAFVVDPVYKETFVLTSDKQSSDIPEKARPETVARLPLISFETGGNMQKVVDDWFRQASVEPNPIMSLGNVEAIKELVAAGLGHAILPRSAFLSGSDSRFILTELAPGLERAIAVVVRQDKRLSRALRETIRLLKDV